jgi:uncharacterized membrane protein YhfC
MLSIAHVINFLGMILLPIVAAVYLTRKFRLSWRLLLAGGLTFVASQVPHVPLVLALTSTFKSWGWIAYAVTLGLLAGIFEETARYILFKFILRKARTWNEGLYVGLGHGGAEAILLGIFAALAFANMLVYRNVDLSTVPSIPANQLELAKQQVAAYWSAPAYVAVLGMVERLFAVCLHMALSVMVLYGVVDKRPIWFWTALLWHATVDGVAVYLGPRLSNLALEAVVGVFAIISLWILFALRAKFAQTTAGLSEQGLAEG